MTSTGTNSAKTTEFEQSITVDAPADDIFDFISDVKDVPQYLPTVKTTAVNAVRLPIHSD